MTPKNRKKKVKKSQAIQNYEKLLLLTKYKTTYIAAEDKVIRWCFGDDGRINIEGVYTNPFKVWPFKEVTLPLESQP